jgi:predicted PurR-regulated permease PerM
LIIAAGWGLWSIRPVLAPFLLAIVIAYVLAPLVNFLARLGLHRGWAILAVYALLGALATLAVVKLLPATITELNRLTEAIPRYSERAHGLIDGLQRNIREMGLPNGVREGLDRAITQLEVRSVVALQGLISVKTLGAAAEFMASLLLAPFLAFYLLRDLDRFKERFLLSLPRRYRQEIIQLLRGLDRVLSGFVRGQMILAGLVGCLAALATWALGLRFAVLLGIWAGVTEMIPYVGPILGAVPAVLAGLSISPWKGVEVAIAFAIIQQLENAVLSPKIMGESLGLHPIGVLFAVLAGGYLTGGWGLIFALPAAGLIRVLWHFLIARLTEAPAAAIAAAPARPEPATHE